MMWPEASPSPFCGRVDDHEEHPWTTPQARAYGVAPYQCPGGPRGTRGEREPRHP